MLGASVGVLAGRLVAAQAELSGALDGVTDAEAWTAPAEGEWTIAEVCAHVIEMQPLWAGKAANIADAREVGRTPEEAERRTAEIERRSRDDVDTILGQLAESGAEALAILRRMREPDLDAVDSTGSISGRDVVERYLIGHIEEHAAQVRESARRSE